MALKHASGGEMKESGVEWLGEIPSHWDVKRLKLIAALRTSNVDKKSVVTDKEVWLLNYTDVYYNEYITDAIEFMRATATSKQIELFELQEGDVIVTKDSETWDDIAVPACVAQELVGVVCGYHLALIRPSPNQSDGAYIARQFASTPGAYQFKVGANGVTRFGLPQRMLRDALFLVPPLHEQRAIAAYLDAETARIDNLIAKTERLNALLREKRVALISRAVTKGLDADVEMKDSGVEWLGEIPSHWDVKRLKYIAVVRTSNVDKKSVETDDEVSLLNYTDVYYNEYVTDTIEFMRATATSKQIQLFELQEGDVVVTKDSESWDDIAVPACVAKDLSGVVCGYHLTLIRPFSEQLCGRYLARQVASTPGAFQFKVRANGVTRFGLSQKVVRDSLFLAPPLDEQRAIASCLDRETARIDALIAKNDRLLDLLREKRTALISAAVTGKISVPPPQTPPP